MNHSLNRIVILLVGPLLALAVGCTRTPEAPFRVAESVKELPALHQENIQSGLLAMFGTPSRPRVVLPLEEDAEDTEDVSESPVDSPVKELMDTASLIHGAQVYQNRCAGCHGVDGDGQGLAADHLRPKPRDYRRGVYKFTSTPYGGRPTRQDLVRTIRRGAKGTSMPAFPWMSDEDLHAVVDYVVYLSLRGSVETAVATMSDDYDEDEAIDPIEFTDALESEWESWQEAESQIVLAQSAQPAYNHESVELGRKLFIKSSCYQCHGADAKGQTEWLSPEFLAAQQSAPPGERVEINYDAWGHPAPAADITARMLHGGRRPIDIYRRIHTGINGTPMPAFGQIFEEEPDSIWHLVHYVMHIVDGGDPTVGIDIDDVIPAADARNHHSG